MLYDLIFFGIDHSIPEAKGIAFLMKMFNAYNRNIKRWLEPLSGISTNISRGGKTFTPKGTIPEHLRTKKRVKTNE